MDSTDDAKFIGFKSYPLAGVFRLSFVAIHSRFMFQVIPPCGGIRKEKHDKLKGEFVSSHTPLRGYSVNEFGEIMFPGVSSHTPLRGYSINTPLMPLS